MHRPRQTFAPLNSVRDFAVWPAFEPGRMLDTNAGFLRVSATECWAVFCRYQTPPQPGAGSIWAVRVDARMQPCAVPVPIIGIGIDPRVVRIGARIMVFYALVERAGGGGVTGSCMVFAEFRITAGQWECLGHFRLPKQPIQKPLSADAQPNWEKNWVPFAVDDTHVGLIYSHDPWDVILLRVPPDEPPHLDALHSAAPIQWESGTIRGGTPPVPYGDGQLITFFHAAQVIGSRRVYSVGACVFMAEAPYAPVAMTRDPLLLAPYRSGVDRFGWPFAVSAVFPLGAERIDGAYRLLCGRDDGAVATFEILDAELADRLSPPLRGPAGTVHDYRDGAGARLPLERLLYVPDPIPAIPELPMINFARTIVPQGRTFVDVGAHIGFWTMGLAPSFRRVVSFEPSRFQYGWLRRNAALNDYEHVHCEHVALGDAPGTAMLNVLSYEGGLNSLAPEVAAGRQVLDRYAVPVEVLDDRCMSDVDLLKIDVEGFEIPVLRGAARTIAASRPVIFIEVWEDVARRRDVQAVFDEWAYSFEFLFPRSPELAVCIPRERRGAFSWFM